MSKKENKSPSKASPRLRCDNSTACNDEPIKSPKPLPPSRSGFHGASLLAAFQKEYPPDLPESYENEENEEVQEARQEEKEKDKGSVAMNHSRLTMYHAATALCHLLILTDTDDQKRFIYSLNSSLLLGCVVTPPTFELTVLKGSIKTHVWSMAARYDDNYLLEVYNLPPLLQHQRHPSCCHSSSFSAFPTFSSQQQEEEDEEVVGEPNTELNDEAVTDADADPVDLLWTMSGFDLHTSQVGHGVVSWTNMKALHYFLCTQTLPHVAASLSALGVTAFSRLFSKVLLGLPMRETLGSYFKPMPATLMLQDMLSVCSYPCEVVGFAVEDFQDPYVQARLEVVEKFNDILCFAMFCYVIQCKHGGKNGCTHQSRLLYLVKYYCSLPLVYCAK